MRPRPRCGVASLSPACACGVVLTEHPNRRRIGLVRCNLERKRMAVTVPVPLTPDEQAALVAQAKARGVSVASLPHRAILQIIDAAPELDQRKLSAEELDSVFEEIADLIPTGTPSLSDEALSRESIYTREDEWNKNSR